MDFTRLVLFIHIVAVIAYVGGNIAHTSAALQAARTAKIGSLLAVEETVGKLTGIGAVLTLVTGVGLVLMTPAWRFSMPFVIGGLIAMVAAGAIHGMIGAKTLGALRAEQEVSRSDDSSPNRAALDKLARASVAATILLLAATWLMVFKPS